MRNNFYVSIILMIFLSIIPVNAQEDVVDPGVTPDSFLWGLDKAIDQLSLLLTFDKGEKARKGLRIARERLLEVKAMIEQNKLEAAEKAQVAHERSLERIRLNVRDLERDNSEEEIEELVEIEQELEEHDEEIKQTSLNLNIKIRGQLDQEKIDFINSILIRLEGKTGDVRIDISDKKERVKVRIREETGKSEEEIEEHLEEIEERIGLKRQEKALEDIEDAREEFLERSEDISDAIRTRFNDLLEQAVEKFEQGDFVQARILAKQARALLRGVKAGFDRRNEDRESNSRRCSSNDECSDIFCPQVVGRDTPLCNLETNRCYCGGLDEDREIEIEIEEGRAKIKVEINDKLELYELETEDLDVIIDEISSRTGLSEEEIRSIMKVDIGGGEVIELPEWLEGACAGPVVGSSGICLALIVDKALCKDLDSGKGFYDTRNNILVFSDADCEDGIQISCFGIGTEHEGWYYLEDYSLYQLSECPSR